MPLRFLYNFLIVLFALAVESPAQDPNHSPRGTVSLQFPNNPVTDIATFYEMLTKKRLIRDSNLAGPNLSIVIPGPLTNEEASSLIEAALLLNGYTLVPVDAKTSKLLGPTKQAKSESLPLYARVGELPNSDQVVSFFMPFRYLPSEDAATIFSSYITLRPFGSIVAAPNVNALIITENVPLIRRLISLKEMIDVPGTQSSTEFFSLKRADAEKVAEILGMIFEGKKGEGTQPAPAPAPAKDAEMLPGPHLSQLPIQVVADTRTNRVMVIAPEQDMPYIRQLVTNLDVGAPFEEPFERPLRFVAAGEVLPVLANLLTEGEDETGVPGATDLASSTARNPAGNDFQNTGSSPGVSGGGSKPDRLRDPAQNTAPLSVIVGNARIIADRSSNKIIVIGPPESRAKAARVLDMLDRRPKQIYLATVIGQLALGEGLNAGIQYPGSVSGSFYVSGGNTRGGSITTSGSTSNGTTGTDILPGTTELMNTAINIIGGSMSGLSIYGVLADSIDITVSALESTNRFKVISRPVIYTANNKKAVISSGQQVPIPESSLTSSLAVGNQGSSIASTIQYKDVVLKLEVIPLINSNNEVTLTIAQQNDNIQETVQISDNQVPVIGTQELITTVTVPNRHTVILGGLITEEERTIKTGLPFLSDIPGLDYIFGAKEKNTVRRELIIMIQPFIIENREQLAETNMIERANSSFQENLFDQPLPVLKAELPDNPPSQFPLPPGATTPAWQEEPAPRP